mmetsp:Transcript_6812/g.18239  ORF Transcript_6812/g.18239 Transcript_6812/m.18239 type:complete len:102 (+) Transcript_6812:296-601(+)
MRPGPSPDRLLHPSTKFSTQQLFCPHPFEQIAELRVPGILPGVALQQPFEHSAAPSLQNPLFRHCAEQTPPKMQSVSLSHIFVHKQEFDSSGAKPGSQTTG